MMKHFFMLMVIVLFVIPTYGQSKVSPRYVPGVEKDYLDHSRSLIFKPNRLLKIKTLAGNTLASRHYTFSEEYIVMDARDTVLLEDIEWIRGKVYGNEVRKALGVGLVGYSAVSALVVATFVYAADPMVAAFCGVFVGAYGVTGFKLTGARKFRSSHHWKVKQIKMYGK